MKNRMQDLDFEQTTIIPQPDSIYDENGDAPWRKDLFSEEVKQENVVVEQITSETDIQSLDSKLEQASAQIAALQKEVQINRIKNIIAVVSYFLM